MSKENKTLSTRPMIEEFRKIHFDRGYYKIKEEKKRK